MALSETGAVVGSVSGGCIEDDLIYRYRSSHTGGNVVHEIPLGKPQRVVYGVSADEAHRFGLPCGGTLELVLEFNPDPDLLHSLIPGGHPKCSTYGHPNCSTLAAVI